MDQFFTTCPVLPGTLPFIGQKENQWALTDVIIEDVPSNYSHCEVVL